jgi:putative transposase
MGQSLVENYSHLIFSTKHRTPWLQPEALQNELFQYLGKICSNHNCPPLRVGGHLDHIHILCRLSKSISIETLIRELKTNSSKWMKTQTLDHREFSWQNGYASISVSSTHLTSLVRYIEQQREHHATITFQDEFRRILKKNKIQYDEKYLWE